MRFFEASKLGMVEMVAVPTCGAVVLKICCPVQVLELVKFRPRVPVVVIGPPVRLLSVATEVTVPVPLAAIHLTPRGCVESELSTYPSVPTGIRASTVEKPQISPFVVRGEEPLPEKVILVVLPSFPTGVATVAPIKLRVVAPVETIVPLLAIRVCRVPPIEI